ncbi:aryl-sulfate sulfotransferase [Flaviramulus aquimarinus]|uniref:Aryl-sulfate sulfotransferase n=1 Tax=Flaviramulus aquimarinus TaxID=1170456 RepID=A0ABP9EXA2_9FLAO
MKKNYLLIMFVLCICTNLYSQNTVGTISNVSGSYNGFTLFTPNPSTETYLINNCGEVVHQWSSTFTPGNAVYVLENGNLLRTGKIDNSFISIGGIGGKIELFDWDNTLLWEYTYSSTNVSQHHDIYPLPNGNILMLALSIISEADAIQAGRDPFKIGQNQLYGEHILELEPILGTNQANIVWEWYLKDHLIQDIDNTKDNFGVVADNEQLLDINFFNNENSPGVANWIHANSIQYNATLDQIVLSSRFLSEIYIIDHSTTTAEAASHTGGTYGKGGDFLYRWGNPEAYGHGDGTDQKLFGQHYPHWIADGLTDAGKIIVFNNGAERSLDGEGLPINYSSVDIITPPETSPGVYTYDAVNGYGPTDVEWTYTDPIEATNFYSSILSSGQRLPNGNTLICSGAQGYFFEIDSNKNIVWEYINPDTSFGIVTQGDTPSSNSVFRALKYPLDYPAFIRKDLTPRGPIELMSDTSNCSVLNTIDFKLADLKIVPNPAIDILNIKTTETINNIEVYSVIGKLVATDQNSNQIDISQLKSGLYIVKIYSGEAVTSRKIVKK